MEESMKKAYCEKYDLGREEIERLEMCWNDPEHLINGCYYWVAEGDPHQEDELDCSFKGNKTEDEIIKTAQAEVYYYWRLQQSGAWRYKSVTYQRFAVLYVFRRFEEYVMYQSGFCIDIDSLKSWDLQDFIASERSTEEEDEV